MISTRLPLLLALASCWHGEPTPAQPVAAPERRSSLACEGGSHDRSLPPVPVAEHVCGTSDEHVTVIGHVQTPASLPCAGPMTVVTAISAAGGFTPDAAKNAVRLTRGNAHYRVDVQWIAEGKLSDVPLAPDDALFIAECFR